MIVPLLKVEPRSPKIQQITLAESHSKPATPNTPQKRSPPNLKRAVTFKDPRNEIEPMQSSRVFPSPRQSQIQILNQLKKAVKTPEDNRYNALFVL